MQILDDGDEEESLDRREGWERTDVICSVGRVFGTTRLGSGGRRGFGAFWFITRKILDWNHWGERVLCGALERIVSNASKAKQKCSG